VAQVCGVKVTMNEANLNPGGFCQDGQMFWLWFWQRFTTLIGAGGGVTVLDPEPETEAVPVTDPLTDPEFEPDLELELEPLLEGEPEFVPETVPETEFEMEVEIDWEDAWEARRNRAKRSARTERDIS